MSPSAAENPLPLLLVAAALAALTAVQPAAADTISFEVHHKFSARVQEWAASRGGGGGDLPAKGTAEFYSAMAHHDRRLHGRLLASSDNSSAELLAFSPYGNVTTKIDTLGFLYYAILEVGTPKQEFLVALDTGSHLFWLPCDCLQCAPSYNSYLNLTFNTYSPGNSSTSQSVPCSSSLCPASCPAANSSCPYNISYGDGSTTSGVLVADTLYLMTEGAAPRSVEPTVVFGCGMNQTGNFLTAGYGLFGLSMNSLVLSDILSRLISNSFSLCFSEDHVGRLDFGDKGSPQQQETPLVGRHYYAISITTTKVGNTTTGRPFIAIVDSGTSFTYLVEPIYTNFTNNFDSQVRERRIPPSQNQTFEYCYYLNPNQSTISLPITLFVTEGGGNFPVHDPIILLTDQRSSAPVAYCLAVLSTSDEFNIIGENFLTGLRIVFNREKMILGWENFDCYKRISSPTLLPSFSLSSSLSRSPTFSSVPIFSPDNSP